MQAQKAELPLLGSKRPNAVTVLTTDRLLAQVEAEWMILSYARKVRSRATDTDCNSRNDYPAIADW